MRVNRSKPLKVVVKITREGRLYKNSIHNEDNIGIFG
jgi:hypothetical protein